MGARPMNWLAKAGRAIGNNLPPLPHATAVINRCVKPLYCRLYPGRVIAPLFGYDLDLDPTQATDGRMIFYPNRFDRMEVDFLRSCLRPGDTFLDAGANVGFYTFLGARLVGPTGTVIAVEAAPDTAQLLRNNITANAVKQVEIINVALAARTGTIQLYLNETGNIGGHSGSPIFAAGRRSITVPSDTLTNVLKGREIRVMKFDIEGMEFPVLQEFFATTKKIPDVIIVEHVAAPTQPDHIALCKTQGYSVHSRGDENYILTL
jgi:FkbM family methyltransferase